MVKFLVDSERFYFLKDTSCDMASMSEKLQLIQGSNLKLYNANTATLLESLQEGAAGYSGVMANFHPRLYSWLCKNYAAQPEKARKVTDLLTMCSLIENSNYPVNAKYALQKMGVPMTLHSRRVDWKRSDGRTADGSRAAYSSVRRGRGRIGNHPLRDLWGCTGADTAVSWQRQNTEMEMKEAARKRGQYG